MCGICGIIDYRNDRKVEEGTLRQMCARMEHRGPDEEGVYIRKDINPSVGFGHRRLKIIDLSSAGHQPMSNKRGTIHLVFNGEIYNYIELRKDLENKGYIFKSATDTETIIYMYEVYGEDFVLHLKGMFAIAIWDEAEGKLVLVRDRTGKKPLLYIHGDGIFCFASEFTSLLSSGLVKKNIRYESINSYMTFGYVPDPFTIYEDVYKLSPAQMLILKDDNISVRQYWDLDYGDKLDISEDNAKDEVLRLLKESVRMRLHSDVPLGAFLSGGIDSSTVVALMSQLSTEKVKTFSIGFEDQDYSELTHARRIAERFNTEHYEFIVKPNALEVLPLLVERYGEPYADSSCIPTYYVAKETRNFVTVALNGDGADESFAGYDRYYAMLAAETLHRFPVWIKSLVNKASRILPDSINHKNKSRRVRRFIEAAFLAQDKRYTRWVGIFNENLKDELYDASFSAKIERGTLLNGMERFFNGYPDYKMLDKVLNCDVHTYLPNDLLVKVDIASMANSLEARSPFLDQDLMEFAARLPVEYKIKKGVKKYILKKAIKDIVPPENIHRSKMGFGIPLGSWLRKDLKGFLKDVLLSGPSLKRGYFKPEAVKKLVADHLEMRKDHSFQIWTLLMLELWFQRFVD